MHPSHTHQSHIIELDGQFVAAALCSGQELRLVPIDPRLSELEGSMWPDLAAARNAAATVWRGGKVTRSGG